MALSLSSFESDGPDEATERGISWRWPALIGGGIVLALVLLAAGWYIVKGETPIGLLRRLTSPPSFTMSLPPPPGAAKSKAANKSAGALLQPPPAQPAVKSPAAGPPKAGAAMPAPAMKMVAEEPPAPARASGTMPSPATPATKTEATEPPAAASGAMPALNKAEAATPEPTKTDQSASVGAPASAGGAMPATNPPANQPAKEQAPLLPLPADASSTAPAGGAMPAGPSPVKPTPLPKAAATEAAPANATTGLSSTAPRQMAMTAPPPPPEMNEPLAPPGGEPLAPPSFKELPERKDLKALGAAPAADLLKDSPDGPLPVTDGAKEPRTAYARPFAAPKDPKTPRLAVVVVGLGISREATEAAIFKLPPEVALSFSPYAENLDAWIKKAREAGHEALLDLPLEPPNFPYHDAGPMALRVRDGPGAVVDRLQQILGKATSYVGVAASLHSPLAGGETWQAILREIKNRGLLMLGDGFSGVPPASMPAEATVSLVPDEAPFRAAIDVSFARLLAAAQRDGSALAYISPRPVSFERLIAWSVTLPQKGAVLAPPSAIVKLP